MVSNYQGGDHLDLQPAPAWVCSLHILRRIKILNYLRSVVPDVYSCNGCGVNKSKYRLVQDGEGGDGQSGISSQESLAILIPIGQFFAGACER